MSDEEYKILVTDLCSRLPHGVKVRVSGDWFYDELEQYDTELKIGKPSNLLDVFVNQRGNSRNLTITPYLRPMDSMTDDEFQELRSICPHSIINKTNDPGWIVGISGSDYGRISRVDEISEFIDWLNEHHFDYRGLIRMGLAYKAPEGMYDTKI